jgi:hypothetical protein
MLQSVKLSDLFPQRRTREEHIRYACQDAKLDVDAMAPRLTGFRDGRGDSDAAPAGCSSCRLRLNIHSAPPVAFVLYPFHG